MAAQDVGPIETRAGLVVPVRTRRAGNPEGPTLNEARGPRWRRTSRGFYVPDWVDSDDVHQRIVEASVLVPRGQALTGWAALCWAGGQWFDGTRPDGGPRDIPILVGTRDVRRQAGIAPCGEGIAATLIRRIDGLPVTDLRFAASFEMRYAESWQEATVIASMAAYSDLVSVEEVDTFLTPGQNSWTGVPKARRAIACAVENAWSPQEVRLLLVWSTDTALPVPRCNVPVFDTAGRHIATPDLLDADAGVAAEYDGDHHLGRVQRVKDLATRSAMRAIGLEVVTAMAPDVAVPDRFLADLRRAYADAERPGRTRAWTVEPPPWWTRTDTVARRRALSPSQRARFLRYRQVA